MEKSVLIVDDDEKLIKMLGFLFMSKGFNVEKATDGQEAIDLLKNLKPDVIILDLMMPGIDGFEVCRIIKEDPFLKDTPIIVLSALSLSENREKLSALGAYDYFEKPFKSSDLVAKALEAMGLEGGA